MVAKGFGGISSALESTTRFFIVAAPFFLRVDIHLYFLILCLNHNLFVTADRCLILPGQVELWPMSL